MGCNQQTLDILSLSIQEHKAVQEPKTWRGDSVWYMHYTVDTRREDSDCCSVLPAKNLRLGDVNVSDTQTIH